jgi:hypothetical protein
MTMQMQHLPETSEFINYLSNYRCNYPMTREFYHQVNQISDLFLISLLKDIPYCVGNHIYLSYDASSDSVNFVKLEDLANLSNYINTLKSKSNTSAHSPTVPEPSNISEKVIDINSADDLDNFDGSKLSESSESSESYEPEHFDMSFGPATSLAIDICPDQRFVIQPITIIFPDDPNSSTHANALIIDHHEKTIEYFEPNGSIVSWYPAVVDFLYDEIKHHPEYQLIDPSEFCPGGLGPQVISKQPICRTFATFYMVARLHQPELPLEDFIDELIYGLGDLTFEQITNRITELMHRFMCYEYDYAQAQGLVELQKYDNKKSLIDEAIGKLVQSKGRLMPLDRFRYDRYVYLSNKFDQAYNNIDIESARRIYSDLLRLWNEFNQSINR